MNPDEREFVEDNSDSWDGSDEDVIELVQMGAGVRTLIMRVRSCTVLRNHHLMMILGIIMIIALKMN